MVFVDDQDRQQFINILRDSCATHLVAVHAYVLMGNHFHLLLTPQNADGLSRAIQTLGRRYVGWFNHRHQRSGTLWEGRFRSSVIESERYLMSCMRYIELNPQRAGLVGNAEDWAWSSLAHHLGRKRDALVQDHEIYWMLGNTPFEREIAYREFLSQAVSATEVMSITHAAVKGAALGNPAFVRVTHEAFGRTVEPRNRGRPVKLIDSDPN